MRAHFYFSSVPKSKVAAIAQLDAKTKSRAKHITKGIQLPEKEHVIKVSWSGKLQISKGDEIEITRGIVGRDSLNAFRLRNITNGRTEVSDRDGVLDITMPIDFEPPILGVVKEIFSGGFGTVFELVEGVGMLEVGLTKIIKETNALLDKEIVEKCIHKKEAEDIITSAFRILEERIRRKTGVSYDRTGVDLIGDAFNPKTGKLIFGKTDAEREGLFLLYRSSIMLWRNPPSHRYIDDYSEFEIFEIVVHVNLLLNILDKCTLKA